MRSEIMAIFNSEAQFPAINAMIADDFDKDGNLDVCINTNDFGTDPANGRYDALNGLVLRGTEKVTLSHSPLSEVEYLFPATVKVWQN